MLCKKRAITIIVYSYMYLNCFLLIILQYTASEYPIGIFKLNMRQATCLKDEVL